MKILATGLTGLVGSRVGELLSSQYEFKNLSRSMGVDITNDDQVKKAIQNSEAEIVLHLAAKTNVDGCELDKPLGEKGEAWIVNVEGTRNIAKACEAYNKKLIYISTDFIFDGENPPTDGYTEEDTPNPINWYAQTKFEGEKIIQKLSSPWIIMRIAYPYRAVFPKNDFARAMLVRLKQHQPIAGITDHFFRPTFIDDIAKALGAFVQSDAKGIFHVVGNQLITPYDGAALIIKTFNLDKTLLSKTTRAEYFAGKALRPFRLNLKHDKIKALQTETLSFEEGLEELKKQIA